MRMVRSVSFQSNFNSRSKHSETGCFFSSPPSWGSLSCSFECLALYFLLRWLLRKSWTCMESLAWGRSVIITSSISLRVFCLFFFTLDNCHVVQQSWEKTVDKGVATLKPAVPFGKPLQSQRSDKQSRDKRAEKITCLQFHRIDPSSRCMSFFSTGAHPFVPLQAQEVQSWLLLFLHFLLSLSSRDVGGSFGLQLEYCRGLVPLYTAWRLLWLQTGVCPGPRGAARPARVGWCQMPSPAAWTSSELRLLAGLAGSTWTHAPWQRKRVKSRRDEMLTETRIGFSQSTHMQHW